MNEKLFDLSGQVALVTGASRGLGQYFAKALAKAGANLILTSRRQADLTPFVAEIEALGSFLGRLVRVSQDFTCTARQLEGLRAKLAAHFALRPALTVAEFKDLAGVSRKWAVPLLEHCDRVGWTVRAGDERKAGGRLTAPPR